MMNQPLTIVGKTTKVDLIGYASQVPAKIDTGADSSSIWATNIEIDTEGILHFTLFGEGSPFYTGERISTDTYSVAEVRSSTGHAQIRYRVTQSVRIEGKRIKAILNLSDRSRNEYKILIGRRTLTGKFLVDVSKGERTQKVFNEESINAELKKNPRAFFEKYHTNET